MLLDKNLVFSDKQEIKATAVSTNVIDQTAAGDALHGVWLHLLVDEAFTGGTAYEAALETSDDENFTAKKTLVKFSFAPTDMTAGACLAKVLLPVGALRYLRLAYTVTGTGTAGKLSAFIADGPDNPVKE